jgi:CRP-like cAMP-binding protein
MPLSVVLARDRALSRALGRGTTRHDGAGVDLWAREDDATHCAFVRDGLLALYDASGRAIEVVGPGELGGLEALGHARRFGTTARSRTELEWVRVDGAAALRALRRAVHTLPLLLDALTAEAQRAHRRAGGAGRLPAAARLADVVVELDGRFGPRGGWLPRGLTHQLLGDLAGVHRTTVTAHLNDWLYRDWVGQRGRRLRVLQPDALAGLAAGADGGG